MQNIPTRLAQVFWGLAIVGVDPHLRQFDVLPDFIGYILIALGSSGLLGLSANFNVARLLSWVLVPVSAALLVFQGSLIKWNGLLAALLDGAMVWFLLGGVMVFAQVKNRGEWVLRASKCRVVYAGLIVAGVVIGWLAPHLPTVARVLGKGTYVAMLLLLAVILHLVYQVKGEAVSVGQPEAVKEDIKDAA